MGGGFGFHFQPETDIVGDGPTMTLGLSAPNGGAEATLVSSAAGAAGALAGWAISSIGKKASVLSSISNSYNPTLMTTPFLYSLHPRTCSRRSRRLIRHRLLLFQTSRDLRSASALRHQQAQAQPHRS